jgi:hypothetical protein
MQEGLELNGTNQLLFHDDDDDDDVLDKNISIINKSKAVVLHTSKWFVYK